MNRSSNSKSSLFLMEMMIAILFFSLASAVCLRMFTKSSQMSKDTTNLNMAVNQAGNAAELLKAAGQNPDQRSAQDTDEDFPGLKFLLSEYPDAAVDSSKLLVSYDENWALCGEENGLYLMQITCAREESLLVYHIAVSEADSKDSIYSLDLKLHFPDVPSKTDEQSDKEAEL